MSPRLRFSTERFILVRERPRRVLHMHGLGFIEPPSATALSSMPKTRRERYHIWEFLDRETAKKLAASMNANNHADLVHVESKTAAKREAKQRYPQKKAPTIKLPKSLEHLA